MTRVVVRAVDASGQTVPRNDSRVKLSVSGPAVFLGERSILLEDGKSAFFVQTTAGRTGKVICRAASPKLAPAKAVITVLPGVTP